MCLVCLLLCKEEGLFSSVFAITERRDMGRYDVRVYVFVGFWDGDYISPLPYVWYYVGVKCSFHHVREECESKRADVFQVPDV